MNKVVVVMPSYNESANIGKMIAELVDIEFKKIKNAQMHLLVVDDNSPDGTGEVVKKAAKTHKNVHLLSGKKEGLGMAYVRGMKYAIKELNADATIEMDADFQHNPKYVKDLVDAFVDGADYVIGSRYVKGGSIPKAWAWHRRAVSYWGNMFARTILFLPKLHDTTTGFRLTRVKGVLDHIDLDHLMELHRFAFKVDLFYQSVMLSKKTVEVPIAFGTRKEEKSKFSLMEMVSTYKVVLMLRLKASEKLIKFAIVGFVGFVINAGALAFFSNRAFPEIASWGLSTELAIISNFTLNNIWTFRAEKIEGLYMLLKKFFQFNLTSSGALIIQTILGALLVRLFGDHRTIFLFVIVLLVVMPYNYFMYNYFIWKGKKK